MANTVTMPKLGFDMAEGTLVRWVKGEGESINKGEVLAEIETDKATVEVESEFGGIINKQLVEKGTVVPVGTPIAIIAEPGEKVSETPAAAESAAPAAKPEAKPVPKRESIIQAESEPATGSDGSEMLRVSPIAKRLARESGLDLHRIKGTGPEGRIVRKDVEAVLATPTASMAAPALPQVAPPTTTPQPVAPQAVAPKFPMPPMIPWKAGEIPADQTIPLERLRTAIGRRMSESKQQIPHFYVAHEYSMDALLKLRSEINGYLADEQKISINDFIVKAVALGLREFPNLNASISGSNLIRHGHINVGVAVAVPGGLLTVVCRDADTKPLRLISAEVKEMAARVRSGKVHAEDIEGSTFSISNLGMYAADDFIAIINPPEAAILAIGAVRQVPVVEDGQVKAGSRMRTTISADHRVSDGAEAAQFLQVLAHYFEQPLRLLV
jgi:pyruvate dehydrogenase E2 component (dihydrolipoamide acetyltransferase)